MTHLEETEDRVERWLVEKEKTEPTKVDIFFTERCNLKCKFCNYSKIPYETIKQEMSDEKILRLVEEVCNMDIKIFGVLGGESFMRKEVLLKSMKKIKNHGINGSIVTNGNLIEKKDVEEIVKMEWDLMRFSVDGLRKTHDYLRGVSGSFNKVLNTIKTFYEIKKKLKSNSPTVEVNFVLNNNNYKEIGEIFKKFSMYGVNFVYILPLIELTEDSKNLKIKNKQISEAVKYLREAEEIGKTFGVRSNLEEVIKKNLFLYSNKMENIILEDNKRLPPCFLPWYTININSNGRVTPCAQWPKSEGINLDGKSLREIWFEDFENMRETIMNNLPKWCSRCCVPLVDENREIRKKLSGK